MKTNIYFIIPLSDLLSMYIISHIICRETRNTHFMFNNLFFENRAVYGIVWKNVVERDRPHMTVWRMRITYWIPKATNTHTHTICNT
jgi:hypothetical protein